MQPRIKSHISWFRKQFTRGSFGQVLFVDTVPFLVDVSFTLVDIFVDGIELPPARFKVWFSGYIIDEMKWLLLH